MEYYYNDIPSSSGFVGEDVLVGTILLMFVFLLFISILIYSFSAIYNWVIFKKAGRKGWESLIPIYKTVVKFQFLKIPLWLFALMFIPALNVALSVIIAINMSKKFGKDNIFTIGLILLPLVFYPIIAFGGAKYHPEIPGIFENNVNSNNTYDNMALGYCTNCGNKMYGEYCSSCGTKKED